MTSYLGSLLTTTYEHRWALLVGINDYSDTAISALKVCAGDVRAVHELLIANDYEPDHIQLLLAPGEPAHQPTRSEILSTLTSIAQTADESDFLLFYFSGHGIAQGGEAFLLPSDVHYTAVTDTAVSLTRVKRIIQDSAARAKIIILDACHSGAQIGKSPSRMTKEFARHVFDEAEGLAILSSCTQRQVSWEWPEKGQSVFTHYLLQGLGGEADFQHKGFVTVSDINQYVTDKVKRWAVKYKRVQVPTLHYDVAGDIVLVVKSSRSTVQTKPPPTDREKWLEQLDFIRDPFWYTDGGEDPHLLDYFYRVPNFLDILGDISRPETVLVFGDAGSGKSSLRNAIARMSRNDGALPVVLHDFGPLVNQSQQRQSIQIADHVALILKAAISAWFAELSQEAVTVLRSEDTKNTRNYLWSYVSEYEIDHVRKGRFKGLLGVDEKTDSLSLPEDDRERLVHLCRYIVELCGYKSIYFLVDPDGDISSDPEVAWEVLGPLLSTQRLLELTSEKAAFKFFLNHKFLDQALQIPWVERIAGTRVNACSLEWSEENLRALLRARLVQCSEKSPPYESLGQLCPEVQDLDDVVIRRSQNRPRKLIEICNKLFSVHCQSPISQDQLMITRAEVNEAIQQLDAQEPVSRIARLIQQGEGQFVEFKATMRYNTKATRRDHEMDREVGRALCGFMNTQGGTLIIGVDDKGKALGLDNDLSTLGKKDEDGFELAFTDIVTSYLKLPDRRHIKPYFEDYDCKRVYVVEVGASDEPIYCLFDKNTEHEFYIRVGNSTRKLDLKEAVEYIQKHFQARGSQENRADAQTASTHGPEDTLDLS
jgi:hypothetical protein